MFCLKRWGQIVQNNGSPKISSSYSVRPVNISRQDGLRISAKESWDGENFPGLSEWFSVILMMYFMMTNIPQLKKEEEETTTTKILRVLINGGDVTREAEVRVMWFEKDLTCPCWLWRWRNGATRQGMWSSWIVRKSREMDSTLEDGTKL